MVELSDRNDVVVSWIDRLRAIQNKINRSVTSDFLLLLERLGKHCKPIDVRADDVFAQLLECVS